MIDRGDWDGVDDFVARLLIDRNVSLSGGSHTPAGSALLKALEDLHVIQFFSIIINMFLIEF